MANQWFRMYSEFATDPKVQMLSETDQRRFIMILCLRCNGDVTLHETEVAFQLRITDDEWAETKARLLQRKLITKDNKPTAWEKRQYASDSSAERVRRHRERVRNADVTLQKQQTNAVDSDTDTDISTDVDIKEKEKEKRAPRFDAQAHLVGLGVDGVIASEWIALKKRNKSPPTELIIKGMIREAAAARIALSDAMTMQVENGWKGFKAEYATNQIRGINQPRPINGRQAAISNYAAQAAEARAKHEFSSIERDITGEAIRVA